jgi:hypothetical protein
MEQPKYVIKAPDFSCALSPYIAWHHGLKYKSCPLSFGQRDMPSCMNCSLKAVRNLKEKKYDEERKENKKEVIVNKSIIPKIGKTYVSE